MNIKSLLQVAVSKFRSPDEHGSNGAKGLAPLLGISHGSLSHKISPTYPGAHCSPEEVIRICRETGDLAPLQAMVAMVDHVMLPLVSAGDARQVQCLMASNVKEISDWLSVASAALASPARPSDNTMYELQRELLEMISESMRVFAQLKAKHLADAPVLGSTAA